MTRLTRVLYEDPARDGGAITYRPEVKREQRGPATVVSLPGDDYLDLGCPESIVVTIEAVFGAPA